GAALHLPLLLPVPLRGRHLQHGARPGGGDGTGPPVAAVLLAFRGDVEPGVPRPGDPLHRVHAGDGPREHAALRVAPSEAGSSGGVERFGYTQELRRSLGLLASFGIAFSYVSPVVGVYTLFGF